MAKKKQIKEKNIENTENNKVENEPLEDSKEKVVKCTKSEKKQKLFSQPLKIFGL